VLFSLYPVITQNYFWLVFLACLGLLQWLAARHQRLALSLLGLWGLGWPGTSLGLLLMGVSFGWFFMFTPGLLQPSLAGGELTTLFAAGGICALMVTRLAGLCWQKITFTRIRY
jgi:hypothetical protein